MAGRRVKGGDVTKNLRVQTKCSVMSGTHAKARS